MSYSLSLLPPLALGAGLASGGFLLALGLHRQTNDVDLSVTLDHYLLLPPSVYVRCADGGFFLPLLAACNWPKDQLGFGHFAKFGNLTKSLGSTCTIQVIEMMNLNTLLSFWHSSCLCK